jgi:hypothetical protein
MKINLDKIYNVSRVVICLAFVALLVFLFAQKIVLTDRLVYVTDFFEKSAFIEGPYPEGRIESIVIDGRLLQKINHEPVYFNVYSPQKFAQVNVTLKYRSPKDLPARFGLRKADVYDFNFQELPATNNELKAANFEFSTDEVDRAKNKLQFIISAPGISEKQEKIFVESLEFEFVK